MDEYIEKRKPWEFVPKAFLVDDQGLELGRLFLDEMLKPLKRKELASSIGRDFSGMYPKTYP